MGKIILASASPRRRELLEQIGVEFEVMVSDEEERGTAIQFSCPEDFCLNLAVQKALNVRNLLAEEAGTEEYTIIGADTIVALDGRVFGKPRDEEHAAQMLRSLSGRAHQVYTGVCVVRDDEVYTFSEKTDVYVAELSDEDIRAYIATGDPMDKAGAYGIQGIFARHIRGIDGDYYNVVGLPVGRLWRECLRDPD